MKKLIYILFAVFAFSSSSTMATTYYWIGGNTALSFTGQATWTTDPLGRAPVGAGTITIAPADIFIFDGTNVGGATVVTGPVVIATTTLKTTPFAQLKIINGANVAIGRATAGASVIYLTGDGTTAPDLVVDATSTLLLGGAAYSCDMQIILDSAINTTGSGASGLISGKLYLSSPNQSFHTRSYITSKNPGALVFASGSECHVSDSTASSGFNASYAGCVLFQTGSSLHYYTGRSPIGSSATVQISTFETGSNIYFERSNISYVDGTTKYSTSSWTSSKVLPNIIVRTGATLTADGAIIKVENLTIESGATFLTHTSGQTPVLGNLTVDGTLTGQGTNSLIMGGNSPQLVSGSGTINVATFTVCDNSYVKLANNVVVSTGSAVNGKLDFGATNAISGTGTFSSRVASNAGPLTGNLTAGSTLITGVVGTITGVTGLTVSATGISANTNVVGFSGTNATISLSQPATATATGVTLSFAGGAATLATANPNGFDSVKGCVIVTGLKSFSTGTNYVINGATNYPFGVSSTSTTGNVSVGDVSINANVTGNTNVKVAGTLILNSGKYTIRPTDTLRISSGNDIAGSPFSFSKCIVTDISGANVGVLRVDSFNTSKLFPISTPNDYLPLTFIPAPADYSGFEVSAFKGLTVDASPTGTAFTANQKTTAVDAIWNIHRNRGAIICATQFGWTAGLEGIVFKNLADNQIGISRFNNNAWSVIKAADASNVLNSAVDTFSSYTSFAIGQIGASLPVELTGLAATLKNTTATISWQSLNEKEVVEYVIERSTNGTSYTEISTIKALNNAAANNYKWQDASISNGVNYYRIKMIMANGSVQYSAVLIVKDNAKNGLSVFPNPAIAGRPFNVTFNADKADNFVFNLYDMNGKIVSTSKTYINAGQNVLSVPTNGNLKTGNYILSINSNYNIAAVNIHVMIK